MPNRILRDGILRSQRVDRLSVGAELFYRRLMSVVDDFGRYSADARLLRSDVFPLRTDQITLPDIEGWLRECSDGEEPLVRTYVVRGRRFLELTDFNQRLRASQSRFPERVASQNLDPVVTPIKMTVIGQSSGSQETARATTTTTHTSPPSSSTCSPEEVKTGRAGSNGVRDQLIRELEAAGYRCKAEFPFADVRMSNGICCGLRADVAVLDAGGSPALLIECKDYAREEGKARWELTAQYEKYGSCGVPFVLCNRLEGIRDCVAFVRQSVREVAAELQVSELGIEGWQEFALEAIKVRMSFDPRPDSEVCQRIWRYLPIPDRMSAIEGIRTRALAGVYDDPQYVPSAENYLRKRKWREIIRAREPPKPQTERERQIEKFRGKLLKEMGVTNAG